MVTEETLSKSFLEAIVEANQRYETTPEVLITLIDRWLGDAIDEEVRKLVEFTKDLDETAPQSLRLVALRRAAEVTHNTLEGIALSNQSGQAPILNLGEAVIFSSGDQIHLFAPALYALELIKALNKGNAALIRKCPICGTVFYAKRSDQRACSPEHAAALRMRKMRARGGIARKRSAARKKDPKTGT